MVAMRAVLAAVVFAVSACSRPSEPPSEKTGGAPPGASASSESNVILFVGDSLTAGYGIALEDAFPALLEERWRREKVARRARNAGVSGSTTAGVLENLDWSLAPDVRAVFLCVGGNDGLRGMDLDASRRNLERIVAKVKERGLPLYLAGMRIPPNYGPEYARRFESMYPELARRHGLPLMPFLLDGVAGVKELNLPDAIHPNEEGHRRIAASVHAFLSREGALR